MRARRMRIGAMVLATASLVVGWASPVEAAEPLPDLAITSSVSPDPAWVGEPVTLRFDVVNNGPVVGTAPVLRSVLNSPFDIGLRFVSASPGCVYTEEPAGHFIQNLVTCTFPDLAPGASAQASVVVAYDQPGSRACGAFVFAENELTEDFDPDAIADNQTECLVRTQAPLLDLPLGILRVRLALTPNIRLTLG